MSKLNKIKTIEIVNIPFQKRNYFIFILVTVLLCIISVILLNIPRISGTGTIIILIIYFLPTIVAFDLMSLYKEDYDIPNLTHPNKFTILLINLFLGGTIIGWFLALYIAFNPGIVEVEKITYETI